MSRRLTKIESMTNPDDVKTLLKIAIRRKYGVKKRDLRKEYPAHLVDLFGSLYDIQDQIDRCNIHLMTLLDLDLPEVLALTKNY